MLIPSRVRVAGLNFSVCLDPMYTAEHNVYGHTDMTKQEVKLNPKVSREMLESTFLHELMHIVSFQYGLCQILNKDAEEQVVWNMSNGIYAALVDNGIINVQIPTSSPAGRKRIKKNSQCA